MLVREQRGPVLLLRLNRPDARNALDPELTTELGRAVLDAEADDATRVLVLTGTGDRAFCAGMDLRSFSQGESIGVGGDEATAAFRRLLDGKVSVPIVGAANGTAVAGGLELLLGCDVVVVSSEAQLGLPEVKRGLFAAGGGMGLARHVPLAVALELVLTGDTITADRARELGLVNHVVPPDEVLDTALGHRGADRPQRAAGPGRLQGAGAPLGHRPRPAVERLAHWQGVVFSSEDAREGATAFVERREPVWRGR